MHIVDILALTDGNGIGYLFPDVGRFFDKSWTLAVKARTSLRNAYEG